LHKVVQEFEARLFHPDLGNEVVSGKISLDRWKLSFRSDTVAEEIPIDRVVVELSEDGERISLLDSARPELQLYTSDTDILEHHFLPQAGPARSRLRATLGQRELRRRLRILGYFAAACVVIYLAVSFAMGLAVRSLVAKVPPEWERSFGKAEIESMEDEKILLTDSNKVSQLTALAAPLLPASVDGKTPIHFYILDDDTPNACALPGGYIVVNSGLLQMADTPEELLGVLAHEMAHVSEKHFERKIISSAGPLVVFGVFLHSREGLLNVLGMGSGLMVAQGFSQDYETEADEIGWKHLVAAHVDPGGMISMFRKLKAYEAEQRALPDLPQAFSSHPALDKRIARLERQQKRLAPQTVFLQLTNSIPKPEPGHVAAHVPKRR
jgi:Zn-dependent protease with chaperone function